MSLEQLQFCNFHMQNKVIRTSVDKIRHYIDAHLENNISFEGLDLKIKSILSGLDKETCFIIMTIVRLDYGCM